MEIKLKDFDNGKAFDFGKTSGDYAKFRDIYPDAFYQKLAELKLGVKGQKALDLGTGTGVIPRNMYKYGADWTGTDIAENQIKFARELTEKAGYKIDYLVSPSEKLDFPNGSFDVVTACQCFGYFNKNEILPKIHDWLKDGGHFAVLFMAWIPAESEIATKTEELVLKYNPDWNGGGWKRNPVEFPDWAEPYFTMEDGIGFDVPVTFTRESWHGRIKTCRGIGASSLSAEKIAEWEKEHLAYMATLPEQFDIIHYVTILNLRKK
ncbi:MAG: methyltransferase domain-containing protein [Treponema sp.]|nr:methyltransferase domain-containing protein [Treponema sp.]